MSRSVFLLALLAAMLLSSRPARADQWVFMVYMFGDGDLECEALSSFQGLGVSAGLENVDIWVQLSRPQAHCANSENPYPKYNWSGIRRFHLTKSERTPELGDRISETPETMSDPGTLKTFIDTVADRTTGDGRHYVLVLWGHGTGLDVELKFVELENLDAKSSSYKLLTRYSPALSIAGIAEAIYYSKVRPEVIAFDACVMAGIEMAYSLRCLSKTVVASQDAVPRRSFDYEHWLSSIAAARNSTYWDVAHYAVWSYRHRYQDSVTTYPGSGLDLFTALSAVDQHKLPHFLKCFPALVDKLTELLESPVYAAEIDRARRQCLNFASNSGVRDQIDLDHFLTLIAGSTLPKSVRDSAKAARDALSEAMIEVYRSHEDSGYGANGLSIYFPLPESSFVPGYENARINPFGKNTRWLQFLREYHRYCPGSSPAKRSHTKTH